MPALDRQWHTGLCCSDCASCCTCCMACIFPCVVIGYNVHLVQTVLHSEGLPQCPMCPGIVPVCACLLYSAGVSGFAGITATPGLGFLACVPIALHAYVRNVIRSRHDLKFELCGIGCSNPCGDCCLACCCYSCAMTQENTELTSSMRDGLQPRVLRRSETKPLNPTNSMMMPLIDAKTVVRML